MTYLAYNDGDKVRISRGDGRLDEVTGLYDRTDYNTNVDFADVKFVPDDTIQTPADYRVVPRNGASDG